MASLGGIYISVRAKTEKYRRDLANARTLTEKASVAMQHHISNISFANVAAAALAFGAVVAKVGYDGFQAMEQMKLSTASLASTITSFAKNADKDLAGTYQQALSYSGQLVFKMEELNSQTVATGDNLMAMVETMAQSGVLLDINNEKQTEGFLAIANALALVTQGQNQDIQFRQEIRALMTGEAKATDKLALLLKNQVGGNLKENINKWKEQGTLIESTGALLEGFSAGASDLANTWLAVGTTIETMYNRVLRGMIAPIYEDIISMGKEITINVLDQNSALNQNANILKSVFYKGWQDIKNITESVLDVIASFATPLKFMGSLVGLILDGWGQILAILPAITNSLKLIVQAVFDSVKMTYNFGEALWNLTSLNLKGAAQSWKDAKSDWAESGRKTAEAFSGGFGDEVLSRIAKYNKNLNTARPEAVASPELGVGGSGSGSGSGGGNKTNDLSGELAKLKQNASEMATIYTNLYKSTGVEAYAQKAISANAMVVDASSKGWYELLGNEEDVNALRLQKGQKFNDQLYSQSIDAAKKAEEGRLQIVNDFVGEYGDAGQTRFDLERIEIEKIADVLRAAGKDENAIKQMVSDENIRIAQAEQDWRIEQNQLLLENTTSMAEGMAAVWETNGELMKSEIQEMSELSLDMANTFASGVGDAFSNAVIYGENMSTAFATLTKSLASTVISTIIEIGVQRLIQWAVSKVASVAEGTSRMSVLAAETYAGAFAATASTPVVGPAMAPAAAAAATASMLSGATAAGVSGSVTGASIASFDVGGISNAKGIYQTGNIQEAHVPIPSGRIPVEINGEKEQKPQEITIMNSVDPQVMDAWASSSRGQNAIFNIIGSQPQRLRRMAR